MLPIDVAKVCHEANRVLCEHLNDNMHQVPWDEAPEWQKDSVVDGVMFNLVNPDAPANASHDNWLAEKKAAGWKYGPVKNEEKKEHPCYAPYEDLPAEQRAKDHLFKAIVGALGPLCSV